MVAGIQDVPVAHDLPTGRRPGNRGHDLQVGVVDTGRVEQ